MRGAILCLIALLVGQANAMTCELEPIPVRFEHSRNVLLVEVMSAHVEESEGWVGAHERAGSSDVVVSSTHLPPVWRRVVADIRVQETFKSNGTPLEHLTLDWPYDRGIAVGATYLVFTDN